MNNKKPIGLSLLEMLIVLMLSGLLVSGLLELYEQYEKSYQQNNQILTLQENARLIWQQLATDIHQSGYVGCARLKDLQNLHVEFLQLSSPLAINGFHRGKNSLQQAPPISRGDFLNFADILELQFADADSVSVQSIDKQKINLSSKADFNNNEQFIIADCQHAEIFQLTQGNTTISQITSEQPIHFTYDKTAQVSRWRHIIYYLADTTRKNSAQQSIYALYRDDLNSSDGKQIELMDGVEDIQFRFGIYAHNQWTYYRADQVSDWKEVSIIEVNFLLQSIEKVTKNLSSYVWLGKRYMPSDQRLHQAWQFFIALRNR